MHFVKKVPTSDEEKAAKEKERAAKLKVFCTVRDRIFEKRAKGELDDEILSLTQRLLEKNPDIYTFWNIRRETIEKKIKEWKECESTTEDDSCKEKCRKKAENILSGELFLTQACLEENPKSYSAWFHRGWTLHRQEHPDIKRELALCEKALKLDCRNFHVWDHRRVVAKLGNLGEEEELEFSNRLIGQNFSNYSAWHYRAVLLPKIQNSKTGEFRLDDSVIASELKKVTSAFFTDPDDQSAWVYSRWLLEMGSEKEFLKPDSASPAAPLSVSFHGNNTTFVMSKACTFDELLPFVASYSEASLAREQSEEAISALSAQPASARIWQCMSDVPCTVRLNVDEEKVVDVSEKPYVNKELLRRAFDLTIRKPNVAITTITDNCKQLMEMEPKNMWARYMYTLCLMETRPAECHTEILENLGKLATELDEKRKEIYKKLASRQILNRILREEVDGCPLLELLMDGKQSDLAIRNAQISSLDGVELLAGLVTHLDVSGNQLSSLDEVLLPNLEYLTANENPIKRLV
ncbi:protein prenyltransferase alpha subunit repeat-containing domain protein [Cooperia oncophora]